MSSPLFRTSFKGDSESTNFFLANDNLKIYSLSLPTEHSTCLTLVHTLSHFLVNVNGDEAAHSQTLKYQLNLLLMDRLRQFISRTMPRVN